VEVLERSTQLQDPSISTVYKYHPPTYSPSGKQIRGHLISAHDYQGIPVGHIEWGHPLAENGTAVVSGNAIRSQHRTQRVIDALFSGLWDEAGKHNALMGNTALVNKEKGKSTYVP
jgi:hypothetical protein